MLIDGKAVMVSQIWTGATEPMDAAAIATITAALSNGYTLTRPISAATHHKSMPLLAHSRAHLSSARHSRGSSPKVPMSDSIKQTFGFDASAAIASIANLNKSLSGMSTRMSNLAGNAAKFNVAGQALANMLARLARKPAALPRTSQD